MHQAAFVITDVPSDQPNPETIRAAALRAAEIALQHIDLVPEHLYPESLDIGCYHAYRWIQGYRNEPMHRRERHPSWGFWSQARGRKDNPLDDLDTAVKHHWAPAENLLNISLVPPAGQSLLHWSPITPELALFHDRPHVALTHHYVDIFGEDQDAVIRPNSASTRLGMDDYSRAHYLAQVPIRELNWAQHRVEYIRAVAPYHGVIAIQLDWNL